METDEGWVAVSVVWHWLCVLSFRWGLWKHFDLLHDRQLQLFWLQWHWAQWWLGGQEITKDIQGKQITQTTTVLKPPLSIALRFCLLFCTYFTCSFKGWTNFPKSCCISCKSCKKQLWFSVSPKSFPTVIVLFHLMLSQLSCLNILYRVDLLPVTACEFFLL